MSGSLPYSKWVILIVIVGSVMVGRSLFSDNDDDPVADANEFCACLAKMQTLPPSQAVGKHSECLKMGQEYSSKYRSEPENTMKYTQAMLKCAGTFTGSIDLNWAVDIKSTETIEPAETTQQIDTILKGRGDDVIMLYFNKGIAIFEFEVTDNTSNRYANTFTASLISGNHFWDENFFVYVEGNYSGKKSLTIAAAKEYALEIECQGNWTVKIY